MVASIVVLLEQVIEIFQLDGVKSTVDKRYGLAISVSVKERIGVPEQVALLVRHEDEAVLRIQGDFTFVNHVDVLAEIPLPIDSIIFLKGYLVSDLYHGPNELVVC